MGVNSLTRDTLTSTVKYTSALAGNDTADIALSSDFLIQEVILNGPASLVAFDVSGLAAQGFKHLQIRAVMRSDAAYTVGTSNIRFNNDASASYSFHTMYGSGSGLTAYNALNTGATNFSTHLGANATANAFGVGIMDVLDFSNSSKYKTTRTFGGSTSEMSVAGSVWMNTAAITSFTVAPQSGSWISGSRFSLYGSKG